MTSNASVELISNGRCVVAMAKTPDNTLIMKNRFNNSLAMTVSSTTGYRVKNNTSATNSTRKRLFFAGKENRAGIVLSSGIQSIAASI
ncbi:hypothetical protein [Thiolapillus sp.]|uniref:hypothetical protein n=1 Tax=Thiolapillus sp. TaxID=2017437 RepID=UPI003AF6FC50